MGYILVLKGRPLAVHLRHEGVETAVVTSGETGLLARDLTRGH